MTHNSISTHLIAAMPDVTHCLPSTELTLGLYSNMHLLHLRVR